jgi:tetratricopeptide (TPR) repeat protein
LRFAADAVSFAESGGAIILRFRAALRFGVIALLVGGLAISSANVTRADHQPRQSCSYITDAISSGTCFGRGATAYFAKRDCEARGCGCQTPNGGCTKAPADPDFDACFKQSGDTAIAACTRVIASGHYEGNNLAALYDNRGIEYNTKGDYDRAIADYDQAIALDSKSALAHNNRGQAYAAKGDYDRAIADYSAAIRIDPLPESGVHINVYDNRGQAYAAKGDLDRAIADYSEAIQIDPRNALTHNNRGIAYRAKGDFERAIADYSEAIRIDPQNTLALNNRGEAYAARGDYDHAIADYSQAIRIDPLPRSVTHINIYNSRGEAYAASGDYDHAIADYNHAIEIDPKFGFAYKSRGDAFAARGDYERATADYDQAIQIDPNNGGAYFFRGLAELYGGALPKALADLDQISARAPKDAYVALWRDIADKRSKQPSSLAAAVSQLDMTKWPAPVIRLYLGETTPEAVLAAADDPAPAIKKDQLCEANFFTGEIALQRGDKDEAVQLFRFSASNCPKDYVQSDAAVAELKALGVSP